MAIPTKRYERNTVTYLDLDEIKALLAAPDTATWLGRRDHALLALMIQTGVRVSELTGLRISDVAPRHRRAHPDPGQGKEADGHDADRRDRRRSCAPGSKNAKASPTNRCSRPVKDEPLSRYTVGVLVTKHAAVATSQLPVAEGQARDPAHAAAHQRDAAARQGRRHRHDRAVART